MLEKILKLSLVNALLFGIIFVSGCTDKKVGPFDALFFEREITIPIGTKATLRHFNPDSSQHVFVVGKTLPYDSGFVFGTNIFYDRAFASAFRLPNGWERAIVKEVRVWFGYKRAGVSNNEVKVKIYNGNSATGPTNELYYESYDYSEINADNNFSTEELPTVFSFSSTFLVSASFFVGIELEHYNFSEINDIGIVSTQKLGRAVATEWLQNDNDDWGNVSEFWFGGSNGWNMWFEVQVEKAP
jgi:hypothetical protein